MSPGSTGDNPITVNFVSGTLPCDVVLSFPTLQPGLTQGFRPTGRDRCTPQDATHPCVVTAVIGVNNGHLTGTLPVTVHGESVCSASHDVDFNLNIFAPIDIGLRVAQETGVPPVAIAAEPPGLSGPTSKLRISKNSKVYGLILVEESDPHASKVKMKVNGQTKALRKY